MSTELRHRQHAWPSFADWFDEFPFGLRSSAAEQMIRVEEYQESGTYTLKAELPGVDPDKDVDIVVDRGALTVHAQRSEQKKDNKHSEFRYGSFTRTVQLPQGVNEDDIKATYDKGVLTVTAPIGEPEEGGKKIEITRET
jgi:HSP20 family molecular chaperone IbpA